MDFLSEIAKQGLGYLLAAGAIVLFLRKDQQLKEVQEKRVGELLQTHSNYAGTIRDLLNSVANLQKSMDSVTSILENIRWRSK